MACKNYELCQFNQEKKHTIFLHLFSNILKLIWQVPLVDPLRLQLKINGLLQTLENENKAEYEQFIKSLIEEFPPYVEKDLRDFDKESAIKLKSKIEKCFPGIPGNAAGTRQEKSVRRITCSEDELKDKNWLLKVRLKHGIAIWTF